MGTNSKASHQAYITEPTDTAASEPAAQPEESDAKTWYIGPDNALTHAQFLADGVPNPGTDESAYIDPATDPVGWHDAFAAAVADAQAKIDGIAAQSDPTFSTPEEYTKQLKALTSAALGNLSPEQLQQIAAAHGFEHPALVGLSGGSTHPLAHWLDPAYPADIPSKAKIQAVAIARYNELASGGTVGGMTLANLQTLEGTTAPGAGGQWEATAAQFLTAQTEVYAAAQELNTIKWGHGNGPAEKAAALIAVIDAENHLATASCPELGEAVGPAIASASHQVDLALQGLNPASYQHAGKIGEFNAMLAAHPHAVPEQAALLSWEERVEMLRQTTAAGRRAELETKTAARAEAMKNLAAQRAALGELYEPQNHGTYGVLIMPQDPEKLPAALGTLAAAAGSYYSAQKAASAQMHGLDRSAIGALFPGSMDAMPSAQGLTADFREYAKNQPISALRAAAEQLGLTHMKSASRAQLQNYIAAQWDSKHDTATISAAVASKAAAKSPSPGSPATGTNGTSTTSSASAGAHTATAAAAPAAASGSASTPAAVAPAAATKVPAAGFAAQKRNLVAALAQAGKTHGDLPARLDAAAIEKLIFGPGTAANLGGAHSKTLHQGSDGGTWLFKPDSTSGWRASAEAAASAAHHAAGLPAVPVYARTVGGKSGVVQPLLTGSSPLSDKPAAWSQADIDGLVRAQVGAWMVGDHDSKPGNILRTGSGGLVPIDHGAAFKQFGADKLALSYTPLTTTAIQHAVAAHTAGALAPGVKVNPLAAHGAIKAYEQMPDAQWRSLLHPVAQAGAAHGAPWVPTMRERAAKTHGVPASSVSSAQIAEAFLDHAVERKASLRSTVADFYTKAGLKAGELLKTLGT